MCGGAVAYLLSVVDNVGLIQFSCSSLQVLMIHTLFFYGGPNECVAVLWLIC